MANQHRRITRAIKGAVKKLKRGEIPFPPEPTTMSAADEQQFWKEIEHRRQAVHARLTALSADTSRRGHKERLRLDEEQRHIDELFKSRQHT